MAEQPNGVTSLLVLLLVIALYLLSSYAICCNVTPFAIYLWPNGVTSLLVLLLVIASLPFSSIAFAMTSHSVCHLPLANHSEIGCTVCLLECSSCSFVQTLLEAQGVSALNEALPYSEREVLEWNLPYLLKFLEVHWSTRA